MQENKLEFVRFFLYTVLIILSLFLYQAWEREHPSVSAPSSAPTQTETAAGGETRLIPSTVPALSESGVSPSISSETSRPQSAAAPLAKRILVKTPLMTVTINTVGGSIIGSTLLDYKQSADNPSPQHLFNDKQNDRYFAESGLLSDGGPDTSKNIPEYTASQNEFAFQPQQKELNVDLHWEQNGINVIKRYTFTRDSYEIKVSYHLVNNGSAPWVGRLYTQLIRTDTPPPSTVPSMIATYFGAAISSPNDRFQKVTFEDMKKKNLEQVIRGGWAAVIQHYFVSAWVPPADQTFTYYSKTTPDHLYAIGMVGSNVTVAPHQQTTFSTKLYTGPAIAKNLEKAAPGLKLTIDYGIFWMIADVIFWLMENIYKVVGNWGIAIILVTFIIKALFYWLSAKSYRSMSALKALQPRVEAIKEQYKDDKQQLYQAMSALYKQEKVNPMSGCLPILVQIPVFLALYWVLVESIELRQAPFFGWIHDLSQSDPYYILPIIMGLTMYLQQRLNPPPPDPTQAKVMMMMPVIFTALFINFPAGLMVYWIVNNTLSFLQQWYIMRHYHPELGKKKRAV